MTFAVCTPLVPGGTTLAIRHEILSKKIDAGAYHPTWGGYITTESGLSWIDTEQDDAKPIHLCGPLAIRAMVRTTDGDDWGLDLSWSDPDGVPHQWGMPLSLAGGDGVEIRKVLLAGGLLLTANRKGREKLLEYLATVRVPFRAIGVHRPGWTGNQYLLPPDLVVGGQGGDRVVFQSFSPAANPFQQKGSLSDWQEEVARHCVGNTRVVLAVSAAFAGPLLRPLEEDTFGIHFGGGSTTGKTSTVTVACSVWGGGSNGYVLSWRATGNGLEGQALLHNDGLLGLDELGQGNGKEAGDIVYMLGNGTGKLRARESGLARNVYSWRLVYLSSGEKGLSGKLAEAGLQVQAGQGVRLLEIPAECGANGIWEALHGFADGRAISEHLLHHCRANYGTPIRAFLAEVVPNLNELLPSLRKIRVDFAMAVVPSGSDGQVRRVAARFGLVAAAGELARACGVLPWEEGEAIRSAAACFAGWREQRGTDGSFERHEGVQAVLSFLESHGPSRFEAYWEGGDERYPIRNRAGYRRRNPDGGWDYLVFPSIFKGEVMKGHDCRTVLAELERLGILDKPKTGWAKQVSLSSVEKVKFYCLRPWAAHEQMGVQ